MASAICQLPVSFSSIQPLSGIRLALTSLAILTAVCTSVTAQPAATDAVETPAEPGEIFPLPKAIKDFAQLMEFVEEIDDLEPEGSSEQEIITHQRKVARSVVAVANKALTIKLSDSDAMQSVYLKLKGLQILGELGEPKADQLLAQAIAAAQADRRPDVQAIGIKFMIESGFGRWRTWGEEEKASLIDKISQFITQREPDANHVGLVMSVVDALGDMNGDEYAQKLLAKLMPHFQTSKNPEVQQALVTLQGVGRRLNLPGNQMDVVGTLLDGSDLDWASYRGKVVLVDFWATWCGPCRAEVPNILKMYQAYHEKGFEVLGISLDKSPEDAESYIKQMGIPWPTLFSKHPEERGWNHPMAVNYGINGIPRAILVDRDGKVVHMNARGKNLGRELRRLLGEPVARTQLDSDSWVQQVSNPVLGN